MEYVSPEVDLMGTGSELIEAFFGPLNDWGAYTLSLGASCGILPDE
jgi:hypothetical protein